MKRTLKKIPFAICLISFPLLLLYFSLISVTFSKVGVIIFQVLQVSFILVLVIKWYESNQGDFWILNITMEKSQSHTRIYSLKPDWQISLQLRANIHLSTYKHTALIHLSHKHIQGFLLQANDIGVKQLLYFSFALLHWGKLLFVPLYSPGKTGFICSFLMIPSLNGGL